MVLRFVKIATHDKHFDGHPATPGVVGDANESGGRVTDRDQAARW